MKNFDVSKLEETSQNVKWSISIVDYETGERLLDYHPHTILNTASVAKVFLLRTLAEKIVSGEIDRYEKISKGVHASVGGTGVWKTLDDEYLTVEEAACLVGRESDNIATNVLLDMVGGVIVVETSVLRQGTVHCRMNDYVRDNRVEGLHPRSFSFGSSRELALFFVRQSQRALNGDPAALMLIHWLEDTVDEVEDIYRWSKSGKDCGILAEAGIVSGSEGTLSYSIVANWDPEVVTDASFVETVFADLDHQMMNICIP